MYIASPSKCEIVFTYGTYISEKAVNKHTHCTKFHEIPFSKAVSILSTVPRISAIFNLHWHILLNLNNLYGKIGPTRGVRRG